MTERLAHASITSSSPARRGTWLRLDDEAELLVVTSCTGSGPFTMTVRPVRWHDHCTAWVRAQWRRPREWWLNTRCLVDDAWCWHRATRDYLCDRHWLQAVENGAEDL